jgi:hypothetical protein
MKVVVSFFTLVGLMMACGQDSSSDDKSQPKVVHKSEDLGMCLEFDQNQLEDSGYYSSEKLTPGACPETMNVRGVGEQVGQYARCQASIDGVVPATMIFYEKFYDQGDFSVVDLRQASPEKICGNFPTVISVD